MNKTKGAGDPRSQRRHGTAGCGKLIAGLRRRKNPRNIAGMARFGIAAAEPLGIPMPVLRQLARRTGRDPALARQLRATGIFEARILSLLIDDPKVLTRHEAEVMAMQFENWADCDGACIHLIRKTPFAHALAAAWSRRRPEFVKRAGFTLMATLAVHDKQAPDEVFRGYLARLAPAAKDDRNGVKKSVNWALRQIGKRNPQLLRSAMRAAEGIRAIGTPTARWIAGDALRELKRFDGGRQGKTRGLGRARKNRRSGPPRRA
jgi:3-methyladenine DNA glycosylase AlkD